MLSLRQAVEPEQDDETDVSTFSVFGFRTVTVMTAVDMGGLLEYDFDDKDSWGEATISKDDETVEAVSPPPSDEEV